MNILGLEAEWTRDRAQFGDRAAALRGLLTQGYPVSPTWVIPAADWQPDLVGLRDLWRERLSATSSRVQWQQWSQDLRHWLQDFTLPSEQLQSWLHQPEWHGAQAWVCTPSLVTTPQMPQGLERLWQPQILAPTRPGITQGLRQLWQEILSLHSLQVLNDWRIHPETLTIALLVQPLFTPPVASGQLLLDETRWQIEAAWGLGYDWLPSLSCPDYYTGARSTRASSQQVQGQKHRAYSLTPDGQWCEYLVPEHEQNQWVLSMGEVQELLANADPLTASGVLAWQLLPNGQFQFTDWQPHSARPASALPSPQPQSPASAYPELRGRSAVPGRAIAPLFLLRSGYHRIPAHQILVATTLKPEEIPALAQAAGLVLERGSLTSHSVIVARELNVPTIIGVTQAMSQLQTGAVGLLDADRGLLRIKRPGQDLSPTAPALLVNAKLRRKANANAPGTQAAAAAATEIRVWAMVNQSTTLDTIQQVDCDGIGLLRAEWLVMGFGQEQPLSWWWQHPEALRERLTAEIVQFAEAIAPRPLWYRTADWRYPEFPPLPGAAFPTGVDPLVGVRGVYSAQLNPWLFNLELAALRDAIAQREAPTAAAAQNNIGVILPFVRRVAEFTWARSQLRQQGVNPMQLWIMAEVPALAYHLAAYVAAGAQGVAIGLNDLMQLTLGIDRDHPDFVAQFDPSHPAIIALLKHLIKSAQQAQVPISLCATTLNWEESPLVRQLVKWGIDAIATDLSLLPQARQAIARAEAQQWSSSSISTR